MTSHASSSPAGKPLKISILVDTSQRSGRLLIFDQNYKVCFSSIWSHPQRHTDQLALEFKKCKHLLDSSDLAKIYFISGPGSFTGLRVGASFVKALGLVYKNKPIHSISAFKITASFVVNTLKVNEDFKVCISSIGNMAFQAEYRTCDEVFHKETVDLNGASEYRPSEKKAFSPNSELCAKFPDIKQVALDDLGYIQAVKEHDLDKASIKVYTHLDLYPLYLRKSEAEEKYSYDKIKL